MDFVDLVSAISQPRLTKYIQNTSSPNQAIKLYFLNSNISGDIFKAISFLEISLRNRIDNVASSVLNKTNKQWLFDIANGKISDSSDIKNTRSKIKEAIKQSKDGTHDQVLCQLSFGFWCSLFSGYNYVVIGSKILKQLDPQNRASHKTLRKKLHLIRTIRNRIAHQEPVIFNRKHQLSTDQLKALLKDIYWVQSHLYSRKSSQIAFYEQISTDIIKLESFLKKKQKPSGVK